MNIYLSSIAIRPLLLILLVLTAAVSTASPALAETRMLAEGVYADLGDHDSINPSNRGEIANSGLIVGGRAALAIDSGVSRVHGERLFAAWRAATDKPIETLLLTQPIQEFLFGAIAFHQHGVAVVAQKDAALLMRRRCENCLSHLRELLPGGLMKGTELIAPDRVLQALSPLDLGIRQVELIDGSQATTPGTLAVFDRQTGTLFAGGLIANQRIPSLRDAHIEQWLNVLEALKKLPLKRIVPGFGPVGDASQINEMQRYLQQIDAAVRSEYQRGASLLEASANVKLPVFAGWKQYEVIHPQNVQYLYRQLEDQEFR